jgi:acyl-CoA reductase-like NAD-dependent aldehyde dehydrogenase
MSDVSMIIGGERRAAPSSFGVINPATGEVHAEAPECSRDQLDEAFDAAAKAQIDWRADEDARRVALTAAANVMFTAGDKIGPVLTAEQGKPLGEAGVEALGAGVWLKYFADLEVPREVIQDDANVFAEVVRKPMGVVAAITPWNFPIVLASWKIGPALRAGNTLVLKPSPYTPRSTLLMVELLNEVLPPGVLNVVSGGDELGKWMTSHPVPRKVSFTGSVATGKHVASSAAPDLKRVTLELGGNDAAIVLDDADAATVIEGIAGGAFANCGQICSAIKRVYVPEALHDEVVEGLAAKAADIKVGDGMDPDSKMGPIQNKPQFDRVSELVAEALAGGGTAVTGGAPVDGPGYFFQPTVLTGVSEGTRIVDEEQFGPALPVIPYRDVDDAVARANATSFGLSGSVWSSDVERASSVAAQLECGTAWVNSHLGLAPHQPFGGFKWSGLGVENGPWGLAAFTEIQVQHRPKA